MRRRSRPAGSTVATAHHRSLVTQHCARSGPGVFAHSLGDSFRPPSESVGRASLRGGGSRSSSGSDPQRPPQSFPNKSMPSTAAAAEGSGGRRHHRFVFAWSASARQRLRHLSASAACRLANFAFLTPSAGFVSLLDRRLGGELPLRLLWFGTNRSVCLCFSPLSARAS